MCVMRGAYKYGQKETVIMGSIVGAVLIGVPNVRLYETSEIVESIS